MKRGQRGTQAMMDKAVRLRKAGKTLAAIAESLKVSAPTVLKWTGVVKKSSKKASGKVPGRVAKGKPDAQSLARWIAFGMHFGFIKF